MKKMIEPAPWKDDELYTKYGITDDEIAFIDSMIRPMDEIHI